MKYKIFFIIFLSFFFIESFCSYAENLERSRAKLQDLALNNTKLDETKEHEDEIDYDDKSRLKLAFFKVIKEGNLKKILIFLDNNIYNIETRDLKGNSPIIIASKNNRNDIVDFFIKKGADVNAKNVFDSTALMIAAKYGYKSVAILLLKAKAKINSINKAGCTSLMIATESCNVEIIKLLISYGADIFIKNRSNLTAKDIAVQNEYRDIVKLFKEFYYQQIINVLENMNNSLAFNEF